MKLSINSILVLALCFCVSAISADTNLRGRELQGKSKSMKKKSEKRGRELQGKSKSTKQKSETDVNCRASRWRRKARVRKKSANGSPTVHMKSARKITTRIPSFAIEMNALNAAFGLQIVPQSVWIRMRPWWQKVREKDHRQHLLYEGLDIYGTTQKRTLIIF